MPEPGWTERLERLSRPFDPRFIETVRKGNRSESYVNHAVVTGRLNDALGVGGWSFRVVDVFTYTTDGAPHVGHVLGEIRLSSEVVRQDIGVPSRISKYDDEIKTAVSDALKRCAMRLGVAIQLWHEQESRPGPTGKVAPGRGNTQSSAVVSGDSPSAEDCIHPEGSRKVTPSGKVRCLLCSRVISA